MYGKDSFKITDSLPCSQQPATGPYPQPDEPTTQPKTILFLIYFIIVLLSSPRSFKLSISLRISHQKPSMPFSSALCVPHAKPISSLT